MATVQEVLDQVGDDPQAARDALSEERAGANRSTLIAQLEAIASKEDDVPESTETDDGVELAPEPGLPEDIEIFPGDAGTTIFAPVLRTPDDEIEHPIVAPAPDEEDVPVGGEIVGSLQGASTTRAFALALNGTVYLFDDGMLGALRAAVNQAVVGTTF